MSKQIIAKLTCQSVKNNADGSQDIHLTPYQDGESDFTKYTPWGDVSLGITKEAPANGSFKPGKDYKVTFVEEAE